jgi:hypothetical protein
LLDRKQHELTGHRFLDYNHFRLYHIYGLSSGHIVVKLRLFHHAPDVRADELLFDIEADLALLLVRFDLDIEGDVLEEAAAYPCQKALHSICLVCGVFEAQRQLVLTDI